MNNPIVIVGMARTPMGGFQGDFSAVSATELGGTAIRAAVERSGLQAEQVDEVLMGCVLPAGLGQAPARQAALAAGLPKSVPCSTVNKVCGSGMKTVMMAAAGLHCCTGEADVVVAGGMESMTNAPRTCCQKPAVVSAPGSRRSASTTCSSTVCKMPTQGGLMGAFGENCAEKYDFTREQQDDYAIESLRRANAAIEAGHFKNEIAPVTIKTRKGET